MSAGAARTSRQAERSAGRGRPRSVGRRLREGFLVGALTILSALVLRLPDRLVHRLAHGLGIGYYLLAARRRRLVRANLARVCRGIVERGLADDRIADAATDPAALERLVRSAFGHYLRSYAELLLTPRYDLDYIAEHVTLETPEGAERAFRPGRGRIFLGLHFGAIEMPGIYVVRHAGSPVTAPMEIVPDPALQAWLERTRGATGVRIIPMREARRRLRQALDRGELVGLIADRDILGDGLPVTLFGSATTLPAGPAILAYETGAPVYPAAVRRISPGRYAARVLEIEPPPRAPLRPWLAAFLERQARSFEELIAPAPEQWWTIFFPVWREVGADG